MIFSKRLCLRQCAFAALIGAAALLGGCKYLHPGHSFSHDEEWEQKMSETDPAEKSLPQRLDDGKLGLDQNWDTLFPGAKDED